MMRNPTSGAPKSDGPKRPQPGNPAVWTLPPDWILEANSPSVEFFRVIFSPIGQTPGTPPPLTPLDIIKGRLPTRRASNFGREGGAFSLAPPDTPAPELLGACTGATSSKPKKKAQHPGAGVLPQRYRPVVRRARERIIRPVPP